MEKLNCLTMLPKRCLKNIYILTNEDKQIANLNPNEQYCMYSVLVFGNKDVRIFKGSDDPRFVRNLFKFYEKHDFPEYSADLAHGFVQKTLKDLPSYILFD